MCKNKINTQMQPFLIIPGLCALALRNTYCVCTWQGHTIGRYKSSDTNSWNCLGHVSGLPLKHKGSVSITLYFTKKKNNNWLAPALDCHPSWTIRLLSPFPTKSPPVFFLCLHRSHTGRLAAPKPGNHAASGLFKVSVPLLDCSSPVQPMTWSFLSFGFPCHHLQEALLDHPI